MAQKQSAGTSNKMTKCALCLGRVKAYQSLPCSHNLCQVCLKQLVTNTRPSQNFHCPVCHHACPARNYIATGVSLINTQQQNSSMAGKTARLRKTMSQPEDRQAHCSLCLKEGDSTFAEALCTNCVETMCKICCKAHKHLLSDHKIINWPGILNSDISTKKKKVPTVCSTHNQEMEYFCEDCLHLTCPDCLTVEHAFHITKEITTRLKNHKDTMQAVNEDFEFQILINGMPYSSNVVEESDD